MTRLLIYEPSYRRIEADLARHGAALKPLLFDDAGGVTLSGVVIAVDEARPDAAWANHEVFESPAARSFMVTLLKAPGLLWVQSAAAGFDHPIFGSLVKKGVRLTTSHGQAVGMADYVLAGVLDHFQRGPERRAAQAEHAWRRLPFGEVAGSTWLIVGFGAVGQAVAQRARSFGATIVGVRRDPAAHPLADKIAPIEEILELLPAADVVVLCVPLNEATRHLAGAAFFTAMKSGGMLVNVGRGALVDEGALLAGLDLGAPAHAILDVFETEPLPEASPLWTHPRVCLTPHSSGMTGGQHLRNQALFLENLRRIPWRPSPCSTWPSPGMFLDETKLTTGPSRREACRGGRRPIRSGRPAMRFRLWIVGVAGVFAAGGPAAAAVSVFGGGLAEDCSHAAIVGKSDPSSILTCTLALNNEDLDKVARAGTLINRGVMKLRQSSFEEARADLDAAIALTPSIGEAWVNLGAVSVGEKRFQSALDDLTKGLTLGVKEPEKAYFNRALAYEGLDDEKAAYLDYQQALALKPGWSLPQKELLRFTVTRR